MAKKNVNFILLKICEFCTMLKYLIIKDFLYKPSHPCCKCLLFGVFSQVDTRCFTLSCLFPLGASSNCNQIAPLSISRGIFLFSGFCLLFILNSQSILCLFIFSENRDFCFVHLGIPNTQNIMPGL